MGELQFHAYPKEEDFAAAIADHSKYYDQLGGILAATILHEHFAPVLGITRQEMVGTAYIAKNIETLDFNDRPYDPHWGEARAYMRGMHVGYRVMETVQKIVTVKDITQTMINGVSASGAEHRNGLLSRPVMIEMGLRGLYLVGAEAREGTQEWASKLTSNVDHALMFRLGIGTVLHIADAVHIQHNMQGHDQYVASVEWTEALQELSQLNTGE